MRPSVYEQRPMCKKSSGATQATPPTKEKTPAICTFWLYPQRMKAKSKPDFDSWCSMSSSLTPSARLRFLLESAIFAPLRLVDVAVSPWPLPARIAAALTETFAFSLAAHTLISSSVGNEARLAYRGK